MHCHKWQVVASHLAKWVSGGKGDCTNILYRCEKCGGLKTETLHGQWTLEQLKGQRLDDAAQVSPRG
jgi:hypothetical protein